jgi:hypothetical protein
MKITIELPEELVQLLAVLDDDGRAERALHELIERAADGIRRPGSWERPWLLQAFGPDWLQRLEADPEAHWRQRPRRR